MENVTPETLQAIAAIITIMMVSSGLCVIFARLAEGVVAMIRGD